MVCESGSRVAIDTAINADDPASAEGLAQGGMKQERATEVDTGFDEDVGPQRGDDFLKTHQIFRQLQDRLSAPGEGVVVGESPTDADPLAAQKLEGFGAEERDGADRAVAVTGKSTAVRVNGELRRRTSAVPF